MIFYYFVQVAWWNIILFILFVTGVSKAISNINDIASKLVASVSTIVLLKFSEGFQ
jgi:hypothetical protein